jgi:hypothetical protein
VLGQAAHIAKRHPEFADTYQNIAARRGKKIATVAVARKLLTRAYHLLADAEADTTADTASSQTTEKRHVGGPHLAGPPPDREGHQTPGALAPAA